MSCRTCGRPTFGPQCAKCKGERAPFALAPAPGAALTSDTIAALPVGTVLRWEGSCAVRVAADAWASAGVIERFSDQAMLAIPAPVIVVWLPVATARD